MLMQETCLCFIFAKRNLIKKIKMKTLISFSTETGNTRKLAQEIFNSISGEKVLNEIEDIQVFEGFDLIYIGFPIHNFEPSKEAKDFIGKLAENQKIVLFATHAMQTDSPMNNISI
jgi:flavodoxin